MLSIVVRDVRERGRDVEGCIKQWFGFVKPNFEKVRDYRAMLRYYRLTKYHVVRRAAT